MPSPTFPTMTPVDRPPTAVDRLHLPGRRSHMTTWLRLCTPDVIR